MILAFSRTTAAFIAHRKTVTRREWSDKTFEQWRLRIGTEQDAWSKSPRFHGILIGTFLVQEVYREPTRDIPTADWECEGFAYMEEHGIGVGPEMSCALLWRAWRSHPEKVVSVIRFKVLTIADGLTPEQFWPEGHVAFTWRGAYGSLEEVPVEQPEQSAGPAAAASSV